MIKRTGIQVLTIMAILMGMALSIRVQAEEVTPDTGKYAPNYDNLEVWGDDNTNNPYANPTLIGQCTWFAWCATSEFYGSEYHPPFSGNGQDCADELASADDNFSISDEPKPGSVVSFGKGTAYGHVGFITGVHDDGTIDYWDANYNGYSEGSLNAFLEVAVGGSPSGKDYCYYEGIPLSDLVAQNGWTMVKIAVPTDDFLKTAKWDTNYKSQKGDIDKVKKGVTEVDLEGMPDMSRFLVRNQSMKDLTQASDLTYAERIKLEDIKTDMRTEKQANNLRMVNSMISMFGLLLCLYSVFLLVAYYFDKANVFLDFSLVRVLTFGKISIEDDFGFHDKDTGTRHISAKQFHIFVFVLLIFSILWLNGTIQRYGLAVGNFIAQFF